MELNKQVRSYKDEMVNFLSALVRIPSLEADAEPGMPFGKTCHEALTCALDQARSLGFETVKDVDGYAGYIETGSGDMELGVIAHVDVVPEGTGWTQEPYGGEVVNNRIYGRGAMDDKGAVVATLYAMKALADIGAEYKMRVRLIIGCNEETGMKCMDYYKKVEKLSDFAFSPDADYPVINMEKGILHMNFRKACKPTGQGMYIVSAQAGERPNVVPGLAEMVIGGCTMPELESALGSYDKSKVTLEQDGANVKITMQGQYGHASMPENGENAIASLCKLAAALPLADGDMERGIKAIDKYTCGNYYGQDMDLDIADESGRLTCNLGIINAGEDGLSFTLDIRYPVTFEHDYVVERLQNSLGSEFELEEGHSAAAHCVPSDHPLVETLLKVYTEQTGNEGKCIATGGGTYARVMPNRAVAFGMHFPGTPDVVHMPDEYMDVDELVKNAEIIANAIQELACTDVLK